MQIADMDLLSSGGPTSTRSGQPRPFAFAATSFRGERVAQATFADQFSGLLVAESAAPLMAVKRALDVVLSAAALLGLFPLCAILGALIKLTSAGPVFFAERRVGHQGRIFTMLKFRSSKLLRPERSPDEPGMLTFCSEVLPFVTCRRAEPESGCFVGPAGVGPRCKVPAP
jgi:hypothetical protein